MKPRPLVYTPDDSPEYMQEGFESPPDSNGIFALVVMAVCCFVGLVGLKLLLRLVP